ncbi:DUF2785 domain-containing protein [Paenibacillus monticola]|uniref:DUF2785 domain-containing protein n=1 Tax=Paenibacillus monticola TaxID=2666075 RepID=A0A7X2L0R4_9BACL|nr:DUF2785 domain-containing protein [Paenibacillus monticola]MRN52599.1 DUF2785 domain-containing protein [Paenibacillus monticola]
MSDIREKLRIDLQRIEDNQYLLGEGEELWDYITLMLQYIGDPQTELRDELIYPTFYEWISVRRLFTEVELLDMLSVLIDEQHLFYHIGSEGEASVFTRTFSVLVVTLIIQRHIQQPFIDKSGFVRLTSALIRYYKEEKDLRGYVEDGGWAHAAAHGADALEELVQCPESDASVQQKVLAAIQGMLYNGRYSFSDEEDERIASIVDAVIKYDRLPQQTVSDWFGQLEQCVSWPKTRNQVITRVNSKDFLRALYFRLIHHHHGTDLITALLTTEAKLNKFVQY